MANPKHKISKSRRNKRRAHHGIHAPTLVLCPQCKQPKLPHHACLSCGTYRDREVIPIREE